ncbi:erythromycin esterase family protein [Erythrobacter sp.]|uniref:erythromycin esterase family protein n=1 Tax=Erythrobacter sp. TaxID=1042 RepID=UPI0025BAC98E|nr:erythromycin esterase family protein [Erythrobacter sp.]
MNVMAGTRERTELPQLSVLLREAAEPLPHPADAANFGSRFDRFADAKVLLLGEATHGSSEFYRARAAITRRMIERHGFTLVAVEADWPDAARIDDYVRHQAPRPARGEAFVRFPTWMWRNLETLEFADWLRGHNERLPEGERVAFRGLDLYSLNQSMNAVIDFLEAESPFDAALARERYACLFPWREDPARYGHAVVHGGRESCEEEVVEQLRRLLDLRLAALGEDGEEWFDAVQNARIAVAAEKYYRALYRGAAESWNLRDRHMFATLQALLAHGGDTTKAVVWAHNSHIGNAAATAMGWRGEFNIGELCRMAHGEECVAIGFGTDRGTVAAASEWGGQMEVKTVRPARIDSWEHAFRHAGFARSLTDWRSPARRALAEQLRRTLLERAIGVVYRPESEYLSHYFEAVLADQFDAYVWFEETTPVTPLGAERPEGVPETYPFGL